LFGYTAIHLVELGLGSAIVPNWHAHTASARSALVAIPLTGLAPMRVGWAIRDSHELLTPAKVFVRLLQQDLRARLPLPGVRALR
jgi:DNA-binding transcriptional LysR family regulator